LRLRRKGNHNRPISTDIVHSRFVFLWRSGAAGVPGTRAALFVRVFIHAINPLSGRRTRMEARLLGKVLHLATFHSWRPERISWKAPTASWDTHVVMPYVTPYLSGVVSNSDAAGLVVALKRVLASEGSGLASDLYLAVLSITAIAEGSGFELNPDLTPAEQSKSISVSRLGAAPPVATPVAES
jgi:hypothetical protein